MNMSGNGTSVDIRGLHIDNDTQIIRLYDDFLTVNVSNLVLDLDLGYEFISKPAIVADLGFLNVSLDYFSLLFNLTTVWVDRNISVDVSNVNATIEYFDLELENVNDFLYVGLKFVNKWLAVAASRVIDIAENSIEQLIPLFNRILDGFPNVIPINGTALFLDLGFAENI